MPQDLSLVKPEFSEKFFVIDNITQKSLKLLFPSPCLLLGWGEKS